VSICEDGRAKKFRYLVVSELVALTNWTQYAPVNGLIFIIKAKKGHLTLVRRPNLQHGQRALLGRTSAWPFMDVTPFTLVPPDLIQVNGARRGGAWRDHVPKLP
jgi:hypothetical protein